MMEEYLNIRTLFFAGGLLSAALSLGFIYIHFTRKTYPGFTHWTVTFIMSGFGSLVLALRGLLPDFITIVLANLVMFASIVIMIRGMVRFTGGTQKNAFDIAMLVTFPAIWIWFTYLHPNLEARILLFNLYALMYMLQGCWLSLIGIRRVLPKGNILVSSTFVLFTLWCVLVAAAYSTSLSGAGRNLFAEGPIYSFNILFQLVLRSVLILGLIILNFQRLEADYHSATKEIKALETLLPVCSNCKKVRDEEGDWHPMEKYLRETLETEVTHGLCPDCLKQLYPDLYDRIKV